MTRHRRRRRSFWGIEFSAAAVLILGGALTAVAHTATLVVPCSGQALIAAITAANQSSRPSTIVLSRGCTYALSDLVLPGPNGLPAITSTLLINGNGATIARSPYAAQPFRMLEVASGGSLTVNNANVAEGAPGPGQIGGCIAVDYGATLTLNSSAVRSCSAGQAGGGLGVGVNEGTVTQFKASATLNNSTIEDNIATASGGGIAVFPGATLALNSSTVDANSAKQFVGGGILNEGTLMVEKSKVDNNRDDITGTNYLNGAVGGGILNDGTLTIQDSELNGNKVIDNNASGDAFGGAIENEGSSTGPGSLSITNTTISNNTASATSRARGGGIDNGGNCCENATVQMAGGVVADNAAIGADADGGGIFNNNPSSGSFTLSGTTIFNNVPDNCAPPGSASGC